MMLKICIWANSVIALFLALFFFIIPGITVTCNLFDPALGSAEISGQAVRLHEHLADSYADWAVERLASDRAENLSLDNISGTEWPLFGSVFYLWAVESLQAAWEQDPDICEVEPRVRAADAIDAAVRLVVDPSQAAWVRQHWGEDYLSTENLFYRTLLIGALTAHYRLTGSDEFLSMLRNQVESLSSEIDTSSYGLLDDYPGECYPGDVITAITCIKRAGHILGADQSEFVTRAIRGFTGERLDKRGLPPYSADSKTGRAYDVARGCSNSYVCLSAPELWPGQAAEWYRLYDTYFWEENRFWAGFREYPNDLQDNEWVFGDVDAGPVISGKGVAASAFGIGAARVNGRFDHAKPLHAEMIAASWPLPNGTLLIPRLLSNAADAPFLGEACILYTITRMPVEHPETNRQGSIPWVVFTGILIYFGLGLTWIAGAGFALRRALSYSAKDITCFKTQMALWAGLILIGLLIGIFFSRLWSVLLIVTAQILPRKRKKEDSANRKTAISNERHTDQERKT